MRPYKARSAVAAAALVACALWPCGVGATLVERCRWPPPGGPAAYPESVQVEVPPLVADLDADGTPEIVFLSFVDGFDDNFGRDGILRILDGVTCEEEAATADVGCVTCFGEVGCASLDQVGEEGSLCAACTPAIADLDGDGLMEIVALSERGATPARRPVVFDHAGRFLRCAELPTEAVGPVAAVALADLDGDGSVEALARDVAWNATGELRWESSRSGIGATSAFDLDGDGRLEVVTGQAAYTADGELLWRHGELRGGSPAVADLDLDCRPDIVVSARNRQTVSVVDPATGLIRTSAPIPEGECPHRPDGQGGPPVVADVDGDCVPEIGVAGCTRYALYRYDAGPPERLELAWEAPIFDRSSRFTSSTIHDVDGDGVAEVLYNDHHALWVYDGLTGFVEQSIPNTSSTLLELPVVADADGDGRADVLVAANDYGGCCEHGVRVFTDASGVAPAEPVRPLFNQHSYHVTNILDDGRVPRLEEPSWERFNGFRAQVDPLPGAEGPRLDAVPGDAVVSCDAVPPPASPGAVSDCGDSPTVTFSETSRPGSCDPEREIVREWTARSRCGLSSSVRRVLTVVDRTPPSLEEAPPDLTLACDEPVPPPATLEAADGCDDAPVVDLDVTVTPGRCPSERTIVRTWTARDDCGNARSTSQRIDVVDDGPPRLLGVPADVVVDCDEVPPPAPVSAEDGCSDPVVRFTEQRIDGDCPQEYRLVRRWEAEDDCGNVAVAEQVVDVVDDEPPRLESPPERACLWPPNHWMVCFDPADFAPDFVDDCGGEVSWSFVACESSQPPNDVGDGDFLPDCRLGPDGSICVRAERQGTEPEGRTYGLLAIARDACGNVAEPALVGEIHVPHDQSPREDCLKTTVVGTRDRGERDRPPGNSGRGG